MALVDSKGALAKATKDLLARWLEVSAVWSDAQSVEFDKVYLSQIEQDVRSAQGALDRMDEVLQKIERDCG